MPTKSFWALSSQESGAFRYFLVEESWRFDMFLLQKSQRYRRATKVARTNVFEAQETNTIHVSAKVHDEM